MTETIKNFFSRFKSKSKSQSKRPKYRKATVTERKKINSSETFKQAYHRQAERYYGRPYSSLNMSEKAYIRQKAKAFRKNVYVSDE